MKYIGVDIGTSMVKGQLLNEVGEVLFSAEKETPTYSKDNILYADVKELKKIFFEIIKTLAKKSNEKISAICSSSFGESFVLIDKQGEPINDFILFVSNLGQAQTEDILSKEDGEHIASISGLYPHKMYSFSKLMWIKQNHQEIYKKAHKMLLVTGYFNYLLTGKTVSDYSTATRTMLLDIDNLSWSKELIDLCDLDIDLFPNLLNADEMVDYVKEDVAKELGLNKDCVVLAGGHDQVMAAVGAGLLEDGSANDGTGTAQCLSIVFDQKNINQEFYKNNFCRVPYVIKGKYICYAFISTGGALLKWHRDYLSPLEKEQLGERYYQYYSSRDVKIPTNLLVLPHFAGSGTPYLDNDSSGAIFGLSQKTTKDDIYFALMEGASYEIKVNMELLKKYNLNVKTLTVTGGGSKSPSWIKIKTNIYKKQLKTLSTPEGGIYGCFILMKHYLENTDYKSLMNKYVKTKDTYRPNKELSDEYQNLYKKYKRIYKATKMIWR